MKTAWLVLMMLFGAGMEVMADDVITEGYYYISNYNTAYYLCPATAYYNDDSNKPFLTTFQTYRNANSLWQVKKSGDDYCFIHVETGQYLTYNDQYDSGNAGIKRVHLETLASGASVSDNMLFEIAANGTYYTINPKAVSTETSKYLTPKDGTGVNNNNNYSADKGIIGLHTTHNNAKWTFNATCLPPTISYNSSEGMFAITTDEPGVTIRYTTDGTAPSASSTTYNGAFSATGVTIVRAIATKSDGTVSSAVAELFNPTQAFLFKTTYTANESYYMIPPLDNTSASDLYVTTSNVPNEKMLWLLEDAGEVVNGIRFYYFKNYSTGQYMYCDATSTGASNAITMKDYDAADAARFKFGLLRVTTTEGTSYLNIIPRSLYDTYGALDKGLINTDICLNKNSGDNNVNYIKLQKDNNNYGRWTAVAEPSDPRTLWPLPTASTAERVPYWKIQSVNDNTYYVYPPTAAGGYATANTTGRNPEWYFIADNDDISEWGITYYYIRNAATGEYLCFKGTAGADNNNSFYTYTTDNPNGDDNYKFFIVRTANTSATSSYNIIPKPLKDVPNQTKISLNRNTNTLRTQNSRNNTNSQWNFVEADFTCQPPVISQDFTLGTITITCATPGAKIYYTTSTTGEDDCSDPSSANGTLYNGTFLQLDTKYIKAVAMRSNDGSDASNIVKKEISIIKCGRPFITRSAQNAVILSCTIPPEGVTIYYTTDGTTPDPATSPSVPSGSEVTFSSIPCTIKAIATADGYLDSDIAEKAIGYDISGSGTADNPYEISSAADFDSFVDYVNGGNPAAYCKVTANVSAADIDPITVPFTGTFWAEADDNGDFYKISGLRHALFNSIDGGTVKNVILSDVVITTGDNVGAIANKATGSTRIYNCGVLGGMVSGTGCVGGLVGLLDGYARVINCYSYADIMGGTTVGGIVGYNNYATTQTDLRTMVMNCMMYGDIKGGSDVYPVYGGQKITNKGDEVGVNNYNFYRDEADITVSDLNHYNCSWPAEEEYLTRFDYFRSALNANRELCAWWITGNVSGTDIVAKWVYAPQEAKYPILKPWGRYPSMINRDIDDKSLYPRKGDYEGKDFGTLKVTVESGKSLQAEDLQLLITDMDTLHYDYGYYKIQLPYYNDVFGNRTSNDHATRYGGNYTDQVVVGWEITDVTGGNKGEFNTDNESESDYYNFADRHCTAKDIYSDKNERIFAQGGYYYVPEGVKDITIKAHWAKAYYCANYGYNRDRIDFNPDNTTTYAFTPAGTVEKTFNGYKVYDGLVNAQKAITNTDGVYDNAIVLVSNVQHRNGNTSNFAVNGKKSGFTVMSVDLDFDCEPDYALPLQMGQSSNKPSFSPVRFDFVQVPDLGMVLKRDGDKNRLAVSCIYMYGHFEITETSALHFNEIYFGNCNDKLVAPVIFNGGQTLEFVAGETDKSQDKTQYIIAGGNAHMRSLYQGNHNKQTFKIKHAPMSVMGGEFDECYLSGNVRSMAPSAVNEDNPHLYTNGGRFKIIAGAGQEAVNGSVYFQIDHSIIEEFYGGSTSEKGQVTGDISVQIDNSLVGKYCGGPMVGDMAAGTTITTQATGTTFRKFFGAGNGGTSYTKIEDLSKDLWSGNGKCFSATDGDWLLSANYSPMRWDSKGNESYEARYHFEIWPLPSGTAAVCAARRYVYGAQFAATKTGSVTSTLTGCTLEGDFYGGGNLGTVNGNVESTLTDCTVKGSVFGAGYSATIPSFECYPLPPESFPWQDPNTSICHDYIVGETESYTWTNDYGEGNARKFTKDGINYAHTDYSLKGLGSVTGTASVTLDGSTQVAGNVYGGGDESVLGDDATVTLQGNAEVMGSVFGGGNKADVSGNTTVNVK